MGGVPKRILLAYSAEAAVSAAKAGRQDFGGCPHSSSPSRAGFLRFAEEGKTPHPLPDRGNVQLRLKIDLG